MKRCHHLLICLLSYMLVQLPGMAQDLPRHTISLAPALGTHLLPENDQVFNDLIPGVDINYGFDLRGKQDPWVKMLSAREFALSLNYRNFSRLDGNQNLTPGVFGSAYGLAGSLHFELGQAGPVKFYFVPAVGLSYISRSFFTHTENRFIGSHINQLLKASLEMEVPLGSDLSFLTNVHILHLSNGGYNIPNSGLNTANFSVGLKRRFDRSPYRDTISRYQGLKRNSVELLAGIGRRGVYESHKGMAKSAFFAGYNYWLNEVIDLKAGIDAIYYHTVFDPARRGATYQHYGTSYDPWSLGLSLGAAFKFNRFEIKGLYGRYLHYNSEHDIGFYWKSGLHYYITPRFGLQSTLHMHRFQADFVDFGLAVKL